MKLREVELTPVSYAYAALLSNSILQLRKSYKHVYNVSSLHQQINGEKLIFPNKYFLYNLFFSQCNSISHEY